MERFCTKYLPLILSVVAVGISIFAALRSEPVEVDHLNLLIGFMAFVITVYVGVQIYNSFTLRRDIDKDIKRAIEDIEWRVASKINERVRVVVEKFENELKRSNTMSLARMFNTMAISFYNIENFKSTLESGFIALSYSNEAKDVDSINDSIRLIYAISKMGNVIPLNKEYIDGYIKDVADSNHPNSTEIIDYLLKIKKSESG